MLAAIAVSPQRVPDEMRFSTRWIVFGTASLLGAFRPISSIFIALSLPNTWAAASVSQAVPLK